MRFSRVARELTVTAQMQLAQPPPSRSRQLLNPPIDDVGFPPEVTAAPFGFLKHCPQSRNHRINITRHLKSLAMFY
jgi:hypothetical protein